MDPGVGGRQKKRAPESGTLQRGETWHRIQQELGAPKSPWTLPALGRGAVLWAREVGVFLL